MEELHKDITHLLKVSRKLRGCRDQLDSAKKEFNEIQEVVIKFTP